MQEGIEFLTKKMNELDKDADILGKNKSKYDEYRDLVDKITFLDELIDEMKKIKQKKD